MDALKNYVVFDEVLVFLTAAVKPKRIELEQKTQPTDCMISSKVMQMQSGVPKKPCFPCGQSNQALKMCFFISNFLANNEVFGTTKYSQCF